MCKFPAKPELFLKISFFSPYCDFCNRHTVFPLLSYFSYSVGKETAHGLYAFGRSADAAGAITEEQLQTALQTQKQSRQRLGDVLIDSGIITQRQLIDALQMQLGVDYIDLTRVSIPVELAKYVPRAIARKYCVVPVKLVKDELYVAMSDPLDFVAQEELKSASRRQIVPMIATRRAVEQAIATLYGNEGTARVIEEMKRAAGDNGRDIVPAQMTGGREDARRRAHDPLRQLPHRAGI